MPRAPKAKSDTNTKKSTPRKSSKTDTSKLTDTASPPLRSTKKRTQKPKPKIFPDQPAPGTTKQDRMLALLSRPEGATISELMAATEWQKHSVHGFLSGTVKKKLGLTLTFSSAEDSVRRYRVAPRFEG